LLTIEYQPDNSIEITVDADGLATLLAHLTSLVPGDHVHLLTPSWGGEELTEVFPRPELEPIHKVTIQLVDEAEKARMFGGR